MDVTLALMTLLALAAFITGLRDRTYKLHFLAGAGYGRDG